MTVKPGLSGALLTMGIAIALGLVAAVPTRDSERTQKEPAT
jgi:hypothetical protein